MAMEEQYSLEQLVELGRECLGRDAWNVFERRHDNLERGGIRELVAHANFNRPSDGRETGLGACVSKYNVP